MKINDLKTYAVPAAACFLAGLALICIPALLKESPGLVPLTATMAGLTGLLVFDMAARRRRDRAVDAELRKFSHYHDRLVREVARNRSDTAILKEGLAEAAASVEAQGKRMAPAFSPEARMIEAIVAQLGALGGEGKNGAAAAARPEVRQVLELEMAPPPKKAPPITPDSEFDPRFDRLDDHTVLELIRQALREDTIDVFVQPVVSLPQRKHRFYEVFARIRAGAGASLPAAHYLELAQREHLVPAIDNLLLLRCLQMLRARGARDDSGVPYVINISGATLHDKGFMGDLATFLSQHRKLANGLIFELPQEEIDGFDENILGVLDGLSKLGCRFSMDRVRRRQLDIGRLRARHIRFLKMDAAWLLKEAKTGTGHARLARFKKQLDAAGIDLIVEKIEKEGTLRELLDYNIDFGQGWLFGKPDRAAAFRDPKTKKAA